MKIQVSFCLPLLSPVLLRQFLVLWFVLGGLLSGSPPFAEGSFQEDCLGKSPAGIALQSHLFAAKSGRVDSMFCAGAIHLYVQHDINKAASLVGKSCQ